MPASHRFAKVDWPAVKVTGFSLFTTFFTLWLSTCTGLPKPAPLPHKHHYCHHYHRSSINGGLSKTVPTPPKPISGGGSHAVASLPTPIPGGGSPAFATDSAAPAVSAPRDVTPPPRSPAQKEDPRCRSKHLSRQVSREVHCLAACYASSFPILALQMTSIFPSFHANINRFYKYQSPGQVHRDRESP